MRDDLSERVLIFAPKGRNAFVAAKIVHDAGLVSVTCKNLPEFLIELNLGAGVAVLTEVAIRSADVKGLARWVASQPPWSGFPFVLITERGAGVERNPEAERQMEILGNVSLCRGPFHPTTLIGMVKTSLRGRRRQYQARAHLEALAESEQKFRTLADSIPTLCWMAEPDGNIFWYNQRWYEYTGTTPEQMEGWGWQTVHDPGVLSSVLDRWTASSRRRASPFEMVFPLKGADGVFRPFLTRVVPILDADGRITRWFGTNADISIQKRAEEHLSLLMGELAHRSKNLLTVIQSMIRQTAKNSTDVSGFSSRLSARVQGLASTHNELLENDWKGATLRKLIISQLSHFITDDRTVGLEGPELQIKPRAAEVIGSALHELSTNSAKYGAISQPSGGIHIHWEL